MNKGFWRDIARQKGWLIAITLLVALSAGIYSSFRSIYDSAIQSVDNASQNLNSTVIRVITEPHPDKSAELAQVDGVQLISPIFSENTYTIVNNQRVRGYVSAIPKHPRVGDYQIIDGHDATHSDEIVVEHHYASKHDVSPGNDISLYLNGQTTKYTVAGIYFSPSNLYMVSPEGWIENDFGYYAVTQNSLSKYINEYRLTIKPGANKNDVLTNVRSFFSQQKISAVAIDADTTLAQTAFKEDAGSLNSLADIFTIILLFISAFIFFIVLSRNVERKRREIGVYRAMGFSKRWIFTYFISFSLIAVVIGIILSLPIAYGLLVGMIQYWGNTVLQLPNNFLSYSLSGTYIIYSAVFSLFAVLIATIIPAWRASQLSPAEAMKAYRTSEKGSRIFNKHAMGVKNKLYWRDIFGHKIRSFSTIIGIALVLSIGLSFVVSMNNFVDGINKRFDDNEKWDIRVHFTQAENNKMIDNLKKIPGVLATEPYEGTSAEVSANGKSVFIQLNKQQKNSQMTTFSLASGSTDTEGIMLSGDVAYRLDLNTGDDITVTSPEKTTTEKIAGILDEFGSSEGYQLGEITNPTGALLQVEPSKISEVEKELPKINYVKAWVTREELKSGWLLLFKELQGFTTAMDMVVIVLVLLIVGIFAFLATTERRWEFVTLKLIGFPNHSIWAGALIENLFLALIGTFIGIPLGLQIANGFSATFKELMSPPPTVLTPGPIIIRSLLIIIVTLVTVYVITMLDLRRNVVEKIRRLFGTT